MLQAYGRWLHDRRRAVLLVSVLVLLASFGVIAAGGTLQSYDVPTDTESGRAAGLLEAQIPGAGGATFVLVFSHSTMGWHDAAYQDAVGDALAPLVKDPRVAGIRSAYTVSAEAAEGMVSRDGRHVLAVVTLRDDLATARDYFPEVRAKVSSDVLSITHTDRVAVFSDINEILADDLKKSEAVALPLVLLLLGVVFGTLVAALLPLGVGLLAVAGGMAAVFLLSRVTDVSVYAVNIVSLIGLGVAIDYSLFMVSRFREELAKDPDVREALARTVATAGRATAFSGLTVAIGLLGLTFYRGMYINSIGLAGGLVVFLAVAYALTFLPALLAILGPNVNRWALPVPRPRKERHVWARLARRVMSRPVAVLAPVLVLLLLAGAPFLQMQMGSAGVTSLPEHAQARRGHELLRAEFPDQAGHAITLVASFPGGDPLSRERVGALHDLSRRVAGLPGVLSVQSVVDLDEGMSRSDYQQLYAQPRGRLPPPVASLVDATVGESVVALRIQAEGGEAGEAARDLVAAVRALPPPADGALLVTGPAAIDVDTIGLIERHTPAAVAFIVVTTYVLLLLQTGSVVLPLKALMMNLLSIAASFGALVWIFQQGHFSDLLGFTPAPLDPSLPVLLFCIVFGLSMDYEVLLLSRMHEEYERTGDNAQAVANGLEKSGRLITSAALIMVIVFGAFAFAQVSIIKAIGLGLALAVAVDATLVRALVVPASMRLMGRWNWWAPRWIGRLWKALG